MLSLQFIRENPDAVRRALQNRGVEETWLDELLQRDEERRACLVESETLRAERNAVGKRVGSTVTEQSDSASSKKCASRQSRRLEPASRSLKERDPQLSSSCRTSRIPTRPSAKAKSRTSSSAPRARRRVRLPAEAPLGDRRTDSASSTSSAASSCWARASTSSKAWARARSGRSSPSCSTWTRQKGFTEVYVPFCVQRGVPLRRGTAPQVPRQRLPRRRRRPLDACRPPRSPSPTCTATKSWTGAASALLRRLHALLPPREDERRPRRARHQARPPVRQGRDVQVLRARRPRTTS